MKKFFTLIISLAVYGIAFGTDVTGTIAVNTTWNLAGSPYIVIGDITVNNGVTLTVDPNVIVKFNSGRRMTVLGTLNANTATFTSNQAVPAPNDWLYIQIGNASFAGATTLTSCFLRYAQSFYIYSGTATLSSTIIEYFYYYGIYNSGTLNMTGGSINLTGYYSSYGQGIYAATGSTASLNSAAIIHCKNGILTETNSTVNLTSCIVTTNVWPVYYSGSGVLTISGVCDFTGNTVNAILCEPLYPYRDLDITHCSGPLLYVQWLYCCKWINYDYWLTKYS